MNEPETSQEESTTAEVARTAQSSDAEQWTGNNRRRGLIGRYKPLLQIKPIKNTRLVEIVFSTPDPGLSQRLADAHARGFIQLSLENRFALTKEARDFLDGKNAELKQKLERSEDALNRFRQTHGVGLHGKGRKYRSGPSG